MPYYFIRRYDEVIRRPHLYLTQESHMPKKIKETQIDNEILVGQAVDGEGMGLVSDEEMGGKGEGGGTPMGDTPGGGTADGGDVVGDGTD
jgi:hypothetical protein